jgi:hypothetical protein
MFFAGCFLTFPFIYDMFHILGCPILILHESLKLKSIFASVMKTLLTINPVLAKLIELVHLCPWQQSGLGSIVPEVKGNVLLYCLVTQHTVSFVCRILVYFSVDSSTVPGVCWKECKSQARGGSLPLGRKVAPFTWWKLALYKYQQPGLLHNPAPKEISR